METAVVAASGPSLTKKDLDYVRGKAALFAVSDVYTLAPWADVLYACDFEWWKWHSENRADDLAKFKGEKWTINKDAADKYGVNLIGHLQYKTYSREKHWIATGKNSGFQALNLADLRGYKKIFLLGFDMGLGPKGERHFFGDHPAPLHKDSRYKGWIECFNEAAPLIRAEVINCSRRTALRCFNREKLENVI